MKTYSQNEVAELLGVSIDSLKKWRSKRFAGHPLHLAPSVERKGRDASSYTAKDLLEWLDRQDAKRHELLGLVAEQVAQLRSGQSKPDQNPINSAKELA